MLSRAELAVLPVPVGFSGETRLVRRAAALAAYAHGGQTDKAGSDYFESHLRDVYRRTVGYGGDEVERAAALLHDVVEDTQVDLLSLRVFGFPDAVLLIVHLLTKVPGQPDSVYYALIRACPSARRLKRDADVASNADPARLRLITDTATRRRLAAKYAGAYRELSI